MKVAFYVADKKREELVGTAFREGVLSHGDECELYELTEFAHPIPGVDVAVVVSVHGESKRCLTEYQALGKKVVYLDKGYFRMRNEFGVGLRTHYIKVSVGAFNPGAYLMQTSMPDDRWGKIQSRYKLVRLPWVRRNDSPDAGVLLVGSSQNYATFQGLGDVTSYCTNLVHAIRKSTKRPVIYRPKPRWKEAAPTPDAEFSCPPQTLEDELKTAWATVTFGSGAEVYYVLAGVHVVEVLDGVAAPVSLFGIMGLRDSPLKYPEDDLVEQWLANLSYCQWSMAEMASGVTWKHLKKTGLI